ncbi:hypothetical protein B0H10DRAFT_2089471 [Mycena sp. CBHHK59/15]|nr:hypothetical protein B0H10DRAFT_2089471 [Mycena sp. CBHHK59/15]
MDTLAGFWPWMNTHHDEGYPETWDNSWAPPPSDRERDVINSQRDVEIERGRFSRTFGPDVLPGMYRDQRNSYGTFISRAVHSAACTAL